MFYIDDLIVAYLSLVEVINYIKKIDDICRSNNLLTITRGKMHEYIKMIVNFSLKVGYTIT